MERIEQHLARLTSDQDSVGKKLVQYFVRRAVAHAGLSRDLALVEFLIRELREKAQNLEQICGGPVPPRPPD